MMDSLNQWFHSFLGRAVAESIEKQVDLSGFSVRGQCLQIGTNMEILPKEMTVLMPTTHLGGDVVGSLDALPFLDESFSMIFLPFTLEGLKNISGLLNEIDRVLTADGYLYIVGMNPWSLWGLAHLFNKNAIFSKKTYKTNKIHWRTSLRMCSQLAMRSYKIHRVKSFFYRPPFSSKDSLKRMRFLEPVGNMFWPYPGSLYFLVAQKRTVQFLTVSPFFKAGGYVFGKA